MITNYLFASSALFWKDNKENARIYINRTSWSNKILIISYYDWTTKLLDNDDDDVIKRNIELIYLHALISLSLISHTNQFSRVVYYMV